LAPLQNKVEDQSFTEQLTEQDKGMDTLQIITFLRNNPKLLQGMQPDQQPHIHHFNKIIRSEMHDH
jgi:hypothetical protein